MSLVEERGLDGTPYTERGLNLRMFYGPGHSRKCPGCSMYLRNVLAPYSVCLVEPGARFPGGYYQVCCGSEYCKAHVLRYRWAFVPLLFQQPLVRDLEPLEMRYGTTLLIRYPHSIMYMEGI